MSKSANNSNPLRELAVPYEWKEGGVTFWMLPYTNTAVDIWQRELARLHPVGKWVNGKTGDEQFKDPFPNPGNDPIIEAQRKASDWEYVDLWSTTHRLFVGIVPLTIDIDFRGKNLPADVRGLQAFWTRRNGNIQNNWGLVQETISGRVWRAWMDAVAATRDTSMDGPEALQQEPSEDADPLP